MIETENPSGSDSEVDINRDLKSSPAASENAEIDGDSSPGTEPAKLTGQSIPTLTDPTPDEYQNDTDIIDVPILTDKINREAEDIPAEPILTDKIEKNGTE